MTSRTWSITLVILMILMALTSEAILKPQSIGKKVSVPVCGPGYVRPIQAITRSGLPATTIVSFIWIVPAQTRIPLATLILPALARLPMSTVGPIHVFGISTRHNNPLLFTLVKLVGIVILKRFIRKVELVTIWRRLGKDQISQVLL